MICGSGIELYTLTISCGPGSVTGRASEGEESTTNKPLVLEITQSIYVTSALLKSIYY